MDPGMECEFQINTRSPPSPLRSFFFFFFKRGPQKLSGGSHKDGWGSAACSTFLTADRWWAFLWQVSVQADTSGAGRIAPWRGVCSKVMIVTSPPSLLLSVHSGSFRRGALRLDCIQKKKGSLQGDEMRLSLATKCNSEHVFHAVKSCLRVSSGLVRRCSPERDDMTSFSLAFFFLGALPVVPSAPHPHAAQTVGATAGLEANKARRNGAPVPCSAAAGCGGQRAKPGADSRSVHGLDPDANYDSPH